MGIIFCFVFVFGIVYLAIFWKPDIRKEVVNNHPKNELSNDAGALAIKLALQHAKYSIQAVSDNFEEFNKLRGEFDEGFSLSFFLLEIAVIISGEQIKNGVNSATFSNRIFQAGLDYQGESNWLRSIFSNDAKSIFFENVTVYLQSIDTLIESSKSSRIDPGPGFLLLMRVMEAAKKPEEITNEEVEKCMIVGSIISSSILKYIFGDEVTATTDTIQIPSETLSQRIDEAAKKCGIPLDEFIRFYQSYLETLQGDSNWNDDIDTNALKFNILTENEVNKAKSNIRQAALNRTIYRYEYPKTWSL